MPPACAPAACGCWPAARSSSRRCRWRRSRSRVPISWHTQGLPANAALAWLPSQPRHTRRSWSPSSSRRAAGSGPPASRPWPSADSRGLPSGGASPASRAPRDNRWSPRRDGRGSSCRQALWSDGLSRILPGRDTPWRGPCGVGPSSASRQRQCRS